VYVINGYQLPVSIDLCKATPGDNRVYPNPRTTPPPLPQPSALIILFSGDNYSNGGGDVDHYERRCRYGGADDDDVVGGSTSATAPNGKQNSTPVGRYVLVGERAIDIGALPSPPVAK